MLARSLSSSTLPHGVLACRAAVLNLLADGVEVGVREWEAVGAITHTRASRKPISVAYADVHVPTLIQPIIQAMEFDQPAEDVARKVFYIHPALTEVVENALLDAL